MNLRTFLIIVSNLALGYALGLILIPAFMNTNYGLGTSGSEILLSRFFGVEMLVFGIITWLAKDVTGASVHPIVTESLIGNAVGAMIAVLGTLGGA